MSVDPAEVQQRFRAVAKHFPLWRFGIDLFFDTSSWRLIGSDVTTLVVQSKNVRRATEAMTGASPDTLDAMFTMAKVNEHRANDIFRAVFLGYVSVPVAMAALLSDAAPDFLSTLIRDYATPIILLIVGTVLFPILYFCGNWRAKQIAWVTELYRAGAIAPLPDARARR
jgi:hypothetical protein